MRRRRRLPPAPVNVRLEDADGQVWPVELAYLGRRRGLDVWQATAPVGLDLTRSFHLLADEVPGRCSITVGVATGEV